MENCEKITEETEIKNLDSSKKHIKTGYWICGLVSNLIFLGAAIGWVILLREYRKSEGDTLFQYASCCSMVLLSILNNVEPYRNSSLNFYNQ